jgi:hypothetical protein
MLAGMGTAGLVVVGGWYEWRSVRVRVEVAWVCARMADDVESWQEAHRDWKLACSRRDEDVLRAHKRLLAATGGLGYARWRAVLRRRRFRTVGDAKLKATALRARPAVEAALAELRSVVSGRDAEVSAAASRLGQCSRRVTAYGNLAAVATATPLEELRRLARLAPRGSGPRRRQGAPTSGEVPRAPGAIAGM